jgi:hypothetical protein
MAGGSDYNAEAETAPLKSGRPSSREAWAGGTSAANTKLHKTVGMPLSPITSPDSRTSRRGSVNDIIADMANTKNQIDYAGFCAICDDMLLHMNAVQKKRAFNKLDRVDGSRVRTPPVWHAQQRRCRAGAPKRTWHVRAH